jgi:hypothetical protein
MVLLMATGDLISTDTGQGRKPELQAFLLDTRSHVNALDHRPPTQQSDPKADDSHSAALPPIKPSHRPNVRVS